MRQRWAILGYAACVVAVLGGLGWVTFHTLRLERMEVVARADARQQESIRLVLWRMDSTLTPIIAREAARPYFEYQPFYAADKVFAKGEKARDSREVLVASPLLQAPEQYVRVYYQQDADSLTSPQVPTGLQRELAGDAYVTGYSVAAAQQSLAQLGALLSYRPSEDVRKVTWGGTGAPDVGWADAATPALQTGSPQASQQRVSPTVEALMPAPPGRSQSAQSEQVLLNDFQARQAVADRAKNIGDSKYRNTVPQRAGQMPAEQSAAAVPAPAADSTGAAPESGGTPASAGPPVLAEVSPPPSAAPGSAKDVSSQTKEAPSQAKDPAVEERVPALKAVDRAATGGSDPQPRGEKPAGDKKLEKGQSYGKSAGEDEGNRDDSGTPQETIGPSVTQGQFVAHWLENPGGGEPELVFTRTVVVGDRTLRQGFWLDWPGLRAMLLESARDLLPESSLRPVTNPALSAADQAVLSRTLAAIPVELVVPPASDPVMPGWTPTRAVVAVTWLAVLLAVVVTGLVLRASLELAERRGRFVSAVTHELRTPLTTFCLYSQMLADGMVKDGEAQRGYFNTLKSESQRLARIVESVLDYARLSGRRTTKSPISTPVSDLVVPLVRPLAARCEQSGMTLEVEGDVHDSRTITTDPAIVERVVYNLVDNACKYASEGEDSRVHFTVAAGEREVSFTVRDHGPGIDAGESARLFRPFVRGARHGHGSISGLGLGLAIARGLARELGGDLELVGCDRGAAFRLRLPRDHA